MSIRIISWNVNSIKMRLSRVLELLHQEKADLLCLQELKCIDNNFPIEAFTSVGYHCAVYGQKAYNGVAILSRSVPNDLTRGFGGVENQARFIKIRLGDLILISAYIPNGQEVGSTKYQYKIAWLNQLREHLDQHHSPKDKIILAGDFNIAPEDKDVHDPESWRGKILCSELERKSLQNVKSFGFWDTFRLTSSESGQYSWWDYRQLAFPMNHGLRIDFIFATESLAKQCKRASILRTYRKGESPSDHAPVMAEFELHDTLN